MATLPIYNRRYVAESTGPQARASLDAPNQFSGLAAGLADVGEALQRKSDDDARLDAGSRLADLRASLEAELATLEETGPKDGKKFTPSALEKFDELKWKAREGVTNQAAKDFLSERFNALRAEVSTRAVRFEAHSGAQAKLKDGERAADAVAAVAAIDPVRGMLALREQMAVIEGVSNPTLASHLRDELRRKANGAAIAGLVDRDPVTALELLNKRQETGTSGVSFVDGLGADQFLQMRRRAQQGAEAFGRENRMTAAQQAADEIMGKGLPLDQAMQSIERGFQGEDERMVKAEIAARYGYAEAARRDSEQQVYGTAQLEVEQRGRVTPATWGKLTDAHRAAILNRQQAEARQRRAEAAGRPVKTEFGLYLDLRQQAMDDPQQFARVDLKQYVDRIGGAQLEQLIDLKGKAAKPEKEMRDAVTLTAQMNATLSALSIKKPEAKGKFQSYVQSAVDEAMQTKGKPLTFVERQQIIDQAVLKGPDPAAWFFGEKRLFELTPEQRAKFKPNASTDAPATETDALNEALKAQGLPQTPANRLTLYQRAMTKAAR